jgi:predicted membrane GTPase involved in stress response
VNNLTAVGGGGIAGGLQGTVLKIFKTFGYKRIGLTCALKGDVCSMGGLGNAKDGYTIVEGSGLPRLTVVGHQREVDWPTLVRRLQAATEGSGPVVR